MSTDNTYFCPKCGSKNTEDLGSSPNGGTLLVCEQMDTCCEAYDVDDTHQFHCLDCEAGFYL